MSSFLRTHFPSTKSKWKAYSKQIWPLIFATAFFYLNGIVDNFMVGQIEYGQAALGAINSWTSIYFGFLAATAGVGSILVSQFYSAKKYDLVRQTSRYRLWISLLFCLTLSFFALFFPDLLIKVFASSYPPDGALYQNARIYARISVIWWIVVVFVSNYGYILRELGKPKVPLIWNVTSLLTNIFFNSIFLYVLDLGIASVAWATVISRVVALCIGMAFIHKHKLPIELSPWKILRVSNRVKKIFWKRYVYLLSLFTVSFFVIFRNFFYSLAYPQNSLGTGVGGLDVFALTGAIINVFMSAFVAVGTMSAVFVGKEFGKGNIKQALQNSDELKGFNMLIAILFALVTIGVGLLIPEMTFLSPDKYDSQNNLVFSSSDMLKQVSLSTIVVGCYFPVWIWYNTSYRNCLVGGKSKVFSVIDWVGTGPFQITILALLTFFVVPSSGYLSCNFWLLYALFFTTDLAKLVFVEIHYYKRKWGYSITKHELK